MMEMLKLGSHAQILMGPASFASVAPAANSGVIKAKSTKRIITLFFILIISFSYDSLLPYTLSIGCGILYVKKTLLNFTIILLPFTPQKTMYLLGNIGNTEIPTVFYV
jgi:hypothetical protein